MGKKDSTKRRDSDTCPACKGSGKGPNDTYLDGSFTCLICLGTGKVG